MSGSGYTARGLQGAWRLFRFDAGGVSAFEESMPALWHSFRAYLVVWPITLLLSMMLGDPALERLGLPLFALREALQMAATVAAFLLIAERLITAVGQDGHLTRFVIAYNWSSVISALFYAPALLIARASTGDNPEIPPALAAPLLGAAVFWVLFYGWYVARHALACGAALALALLLLDLTLSVLANMLASSLAGLGG